MEAKAGEQNLRERALKRLEKKRAFTGHLLVYLVVNGLLIALWATAAGRGYFWPIFPLLGWGIAVFFHGWDVYRGEPTEEDIRREMERMG